MVEKHVRLFVAVSFFVVLFDQITKELISQFNPSIEILFLKIHHITNTGAGFGIFQGRVAILAFVSLLVAIAIIWYYPKIEKENVPQTLFALLLAGTIGNGIDRIFRGLVIDFIDVGFWPAFNIADIAITISAIGLVFYYWKR